MVMNRSKTSVVCDAGPIIHLDELGCLYLLDDFEKVLVPNVVHNEVLYHRPHAFEDTIIQNLEFLNNFPEDEYLSSIFRIFSLDAGEKAALAVLSNNPDFIFLTDDAAARLASSKLDVKVHGTLGILIRSIRREIMPPDKVLEILYTLRTNSTLHIKPSLLQKAIDRIRYEFCL